MAASPRWKIYSAGGEYMGCMKHLEDCARVVGGVTGWTIRDGHKRVVWTEGTEDISAAESFDSVASIILNRVLKR